MADTNLLVLAKEFSKLRADVKEVLKMPVGPEGKQGERGLPGKDGKDGLNGRDGIGVQGPPGAPGRDGRDGKDGKDGIDGQDGVSVTNAYIDFDGSLVIELSDGNQIDAGFVSVESRDNIVQQLKNGALSLNELLPSQTGNANKYLKTDGENTSWDTLTGSDIDLSSPGPIGSATPAAATFTTLTATGQTNLGGSSTAPSFRATVGDNAPNTMWIEAKGAMSSDAAVYLGVGGTSAKPLLIVNQAQPISFRTTTIGGTSGEQLRVAHTASAVNYVQVTGAATGTTGGNGPTISSQGSDADINLKFVAKGAGSISFFTNTSQLQFRVLHTGGTIVNYTTATGSATGAAPAFSVAGTDTNIDLALTPKGTGLVRFGTLTATTDTAISGYITIKDSGGTTRKLAVIT